MPVTSQPNPEDFRPRAADAVMAPAPMPVAGDVGPVLMPRDDAGSVKPLARAPKRPSRAARDRADNRLFERFAATRDPVDRDAIVERFLPLARQLAASYRRPAEPFDDVFQAACYGLVKAVDRFEPERGGAFTPSAVPTIVGEIKRHFRDRTWAMRVPRDLQERSLRVDRAVLDLTRSLGPQPSVGEVADATAVEPEEVLEAMEAGHAYRVTSLDAPRVVGEDDADATFADTPGPPDDGVSRAEDRVLIQALLLPPSPRERHVLQLRFEYDFTQAEIGERIGVGQMQVSRILRSTLARLHRLATASDDAAPAAGQL